MFLHWCCGPALCHVNICHGISYYVSNDSSLQGFWHPRRMSSIIAPPTATAQRHRERVFSFWFFALVRAAGVGNENGWVQKEVSENYPSVGSFQQIEMLVAQDPGERKSQEKLKVAKAGLAHMFISQLQVLQVAKMCQAVDSWFPKLYNESGDCALWKSPIFSSLCKSCVWLLTWTCKTNKTKPICASETLQIWNFVRYCGVFRQP